DAERTRGSQREKDVRKKLSQPRDRRRAENFLSRATQSGNYAYIRQTYPAESPSKLVIKTIPRRHRENGLRSVSVRCPLARFRMLTLRRFPPGFLLVVWIFSLLCPIARGQDFSIVVLPDTQNEAQFFPQVMNSQTKWIVDNAQARNIQMVLGVGDIVNDGADNAQQQNADAAIRLLDNAGIPYMLAIGNHDYNGFNPKVSRDATGFNQWFGPARYAGKPFYKGNFPSGSNENFFGELTIGGQTYLFLVLEFRPRSSSLDWAESILSAHPDEEAIIVVHSFLRTTGTR